MCDRLEVSKSGYYNWHGRAPSKRTAANVTLLAQIEAAHAKSDATYGMPCIRAELADQSVVASRKRIASIMRKAHIRGVSRRRGYVVTTTRDKRQRPAPDLVKRQFVATDINQLWVADMTYVPTWASFLYLAVVTDVYSRKVVGWAFGVNMTADLVIAALNMALLTRKPEPLSVIHHSDQGSHSVFNRWCKDNALLPSMSQRGNCWDNAVAESFFSSLKKERIKRQIYPRRDDARSDVFCSGQVISDSLIDFFDVDSRSKALGDKLPSFECSLMLL